LKGRDLEETAGRRRGKEEKNWIVRGQRREGGVKVHPEMGGGGKEKKGTTYE